jgi:hypothetical protein
MFRKTFTGSLVAASLTAGALMTMPSASAAPTYLDKGSPSTVGTIPNDADVVMSENGNATAAWTRIVAGEQRVQVAYFMAGTFGGWTAPKTLSGAGKAVAEPHVAINDKGEAVAAWLQEDLAGHDQLTVSRHSGFDVWSSPMSVGVDGTLSAEDLDVAMDGNGQLFAASKYTNGGAIDKVRVTRVPKTGGVTQVTVSDDSAETPDIAVNSSGQAVVAYYNALAGDDVVDTRRFNPANGTWASPKSVANTGVYLLDPQVSLGDNGSATVAYVLQDADSDFRVTWNRLNADGTQTSPAFISPAGVTSTNPTVAQNDAGAAVMAWSQNAAEVGYRTRAYTTAAWATASAINAGLSGATKPKAAISDTGAYLIGWADDGDLHGRYRGTPSVLPFVTYDSSAIDFDVDQTSVGIDNEGNALVGGTYALPDPANGALHVKFVDAGGPTSYLPAIAANTLGGKVHLTWGANDRFSPVTAYDVRVKTTLWNSKVGTYSSLQTGAPAKSLDFAAAPGRTYCFEVRARDAHANYGAFTAPRCTTTPLDDRAEAIAKGFKRAKAASSYLGTYTIAKKKNAVMSIQQVKASRIAILVTKVAKGGKIQVSFAGKKLGTFSLKGSGNKKLIAAKNLGGVKSGSLVIKVISKTGKVVRIDGVVIAK